MNNYEREKIEKDAKKNGYSWNSDGSRLVNGSKAITFSETGNSVQVKGSTTTYTNANDVKNSRNY